MFLAIDIGNTNITFGIFSAGGKIRRLIKTFDIPTKEYSRTKIACRMKSGIEEIIICSVVPRVTKILENDLQKISGVKPLVLGRDMAVPIKNLYRKPGEVGQDRLVNAYAGVALYGAPLIIIDFGTAITFDIISAKKEYLGGLILPGLQMSLDALSERTALLPKVKIHTPRSFMGRDTVSSMNNGIVYGFSNLVDGLITKLREEFFKRNNVLVIATGGNSGFICAHSRLITEMDTGLTLKGVEIISHIFK